MLFLLSGAFALDCTGPGLDADICEAVNQITLDVNARTGAPTIRDSARVRLRPNTLYNQLLRVKTTLPAAEACEVTGFVSGVYAADGSVEGTWRDFDGSVGTVDAAYVAATHEFTGSFEGSRTGPVGNGFGFYNNTRQTVGNWSNEFVGGMFQRVRGKTGVTVALRGTCDGLITDALDPWWRGELATTVEPLRIFVTTPYDAMVDPRPFTGTAALDQRCQDEADDAFGLGETTFIAGVSDLPNGVDSPDQRPGMEAGRPLVQAVNGRWLGGDVVDFFDVLTTVAAPVNVQADGTVFTVNPEAPLSTDIVWWGDYGPTGPVGAYGSGDCAGWTDGTTGAGVVGGIPHRSGIRLGRFAANCAQIQGRSYCVEVD